MDERSERNPKLTALGWITLAVVGLLVCGLVVAGGRAIYAATRSLERGGSLADVTPPPDAPTPKPTDPPTAVPTGTPAPTPTSEGWTTWTDGLGQDYLVPPPEIEAQIWETVEIVIRATNALVDTDTPTVADAPTLEEYQARVEQAEERYPGYEASQDLLALITPEGWFQPSPLDCMDYDTCVAVTVQQASIVGMALYTDEICGKPGTVGTPGTLPCLIETELPTSRTMATFVVELDDDGVWRVSEHQYPSAPERSDQD